MLYLSGEIMMQIWSLDRPPSSLYTVFEFTFNSEKNSLMTRMWVPCGFLLFQGTQNEITGS